MKQRKSCWLILAVAAVFAGMLVLNFTIPYIADDYQDKLIYGTTIPVTNLLGVLQSVRNLYLIWTGRSVAHFFVFSLLAVNKVIFNLLNTAVFVGLILLMCKHIAGKKRITATMFLVVSAMSWFLLPAFGETCLMLTSAANYLWTTDLILLFLLPYRMSFEEETKQGGKVAVAGMCLFGIIAGWTNENTAGAMLLYIAGFLVFRRFKKLPVPKWAYSGGAGALAGFWAMIAAPGNFVRSEGLKSSQPFLIQLKSRFRDLLWVALHDMNILLIIVLLAVVVYFLLKMYRKPEPYLPFFYGVAGAATMASGILSPAVPLRAYFGAACYLIIAAGVVIHEIVLRFLPGWPRRAVLIALLTATFLPSFIPAYQDILNTYQIYSYREIAIRLAKAEGNLNPVVVQAKAETQYNPLFHLDDIQDDKNFWVNRNVALYYGLQSIRGETEENYVASTNLQKLENLPDKDSANEMYHGMIVDFCDGKHVDQQGTITVNRKATDIEISGWAADFASKKPLKYIYVMVGDDVVFGNYGEPRLTVAQFYKDKALTNTGFSFKLNPKDLQKADQLSFVLVGSDGTYKYQPVNYQINWTN